jgi:hypothetical protein
MFGSVGDGDKKDARKILDEISLTILSIPRGPSDVRTASLIATIHYYFLNTHPLDLKLHAFCSDQVGQANLHRFSLT